MLRETQEGLKTYGEKSGRNQKDYTLSSSGHLPMKDMSKGEGGNEEDINKDTSVLIEEDEGMKPGK